MRIAFAAFFGLIFGGIVGLGTGVGIGMLLQRIVNVGCSAGGCAYFVIFWAGLGLVVCALLGAILAGVLSRENTRASLPRHH
ncbi:hypothetical protein K32_18790 [Kaistia sp. 32K]|uniref:hypothetical protein n=1 Tax=Kaistia sp. 32K TaxID=2795690 RepID=UPI001914DA83|nr:hypothetical protein [Kaistia sp. 32K]BCP53262.1 hypothetical protein K32_18790 [Kaistia sp. 32K]